MKNIIVSALMAVCNKPFRVALKVLKAAAVNPPLNKGLKDNFPKPYR